MKFGLARTKKFKKSFKKLQESNENKKIQYILSILSNKKLKQICARQS